MSTWMWAAAGAAAALGTPTSVLAGFVAGRAATRASMQVQLAAATTAATTDPLTGLANRAGLQSELDRRVAGNAAFAVLLVDLDGFKAVNDNHGGHAVGDRVLIRVAERLTELVGGAGLVTRLGGDEFVIVAASAVGVVSKLLAHDVRRVVARPVALGDGAGVSGSVAVSSSVGVVHAWPGEDPRVLLAAADEAMYRAKTSGAGVVEYDLATRMAPTVADRPAVRLRDLARIGRDLRGHRAAAGSVTDAVAGTDRSVAGRRGHTDRWGRLDINTTDTTRDGGAR
jgi:diguanylate cyclase (GGDEF)-like protein